MKINYINNINIRSSVKFFTLSAICCFLCLPAEAQRRRVAVSNSMSTNYAKPMHYISGALGMFGSSGGYYTGQRSDSNQTTTAANNLSGLFGIGADYDYMMADDLSVGGLFRYYSTSDSLGDSTSTQPEVTLTALTIGGMVRAYFQTENWIFSAGTGLGIFSPTYKYKQGGTNYDVDVNTGFGLYTSLGMGFKVNEDFVLGVENLRMLGLGEKLNGWILNDFMIKGRFSFGG